MNKTDMKKIMLQLGVALGLTLVLISVIVYVTDITFSNNLILQYLVTFIMLAAMIFFIVLGIKKYKKDNEGFISLSEALKIGLGIAVVAGVISGLYDIIFTQYIDPDFIEKVLLFTQEKMIETNPNITQDELDIVTKVTRILSDPWIQFPLSIVKFLFGGFIISLIAGLVLKKESQQY